MNGLQKRASPPIEFSGVAVTPTMALAGQQVTATTAMR